MVVLKFNKEVTRYTNYLSQHNKLPQISVD